MSHDRRHVSQGVALDGEDGEIGGPELLDSVCRSYARPHHPFGRPDLEALLAQRLQVRPAGEAGDFVSPARELSAVIGADGTGT